MTASVREDMFPSHRVSQYQYNECSETPTIEIIVQQNCKVGSKGIWARCGLHKQSPDGYHERQMHLS